MPNNIAGIATPTMTPEQEKEARAKQMAEVGKRISTVAQTPGYQQKSRPYFPGNELPDAYQQQVQHGMAQQGFNAIDEGTKGKWREDALQRLYGAR